MKLMILPKKSYALGIPFIGYFIGKYLDDQETLRMTLFRDKSALYGGKVKEGEKPTWP